MQHQAPYDLYLDWLGEVEKCENVCSDVGMPDMPSKSLPDMSWSQESCSLTSLCSLCSFVLMKYPERVFLGGLAATESGSHLHNYRLPSLDSSGATVAALSFVLFKAEPSQQNSNKAKG